MGSSIILHTDPYSAQLPSPQEMAELDQLTIDSGVPAKELMERAGSAVAESALAWCDRNEVKQNTAVVLCGFGNNGGDGLVIARKLMEAGVQAHVVSVSSKRYSDLFHVNAQRWTQMGGKLFVFGTEEENLPDSVSISLEDCTQLLRESDVVFDALLGTGQRSEPRGHVAQLIQLIQSSDRKAKVLAVDIPTGVNADTGEVYTNFLQADATFCIELLKRGMLQYPARKSCGEIETIPIGITHELSVEYRWLDSRTVPKLTPRQEDSHKGDQGHVLVIGGSPDMPGAPYLACLGALRAGAGLVTKVELSSWRGLREIPEVLYHTVETSTGEGYFCAENVKAIEPLVDGKSAVVLGPGLGMNSQTISFVHECLNLCQSKGIAMILDADALNCLASQKVLPQLSRTVLTPHPGEMGRLLGSDTAAVQKDRYQSAASLAETTGGVVVLKGAATVIYCQGHGYVNSTGNPFMATGGSGDVLSGLIGGLVAQTENLVDSALTGVYCHGEAGDLATVLTGGAISAREIAQSIPKALASVTVNE